MAIFEIWDVPALWWGMHLKFGDSRKTANKPETWQRPYSKFGQEIMRASANALITSIPANEADSLACISLKVSVKVFAALPSALMKQICGSFISLADAAIA